MFYLRPKHAHASFMELIRDRFDACKSTWHQSKHVELIAIVDALASAKTERLWIIADLGRTSEHGPDVGTSATSRVSRCPHSAPWGWVFVGKGWEDAGIGMGGF